MNRIFLYSLAFVLCLGCSKKGSTPTSSRVDIYMLKSYTMNFTSTGGYNVPVISNAVLADTSLVADENIESYTQSTETFNLKKNVQPAIISYSTDKAFAVTVDKQPIYFGIFHPGYLNSISLWIATIDPIFSYNNQLSIQFEEISGVSNLQKYDKRNDNRIINALKASGRLK